MGVDAGVVKKSGSWYSCDSERLGQGKENTRQYLTDNAELAGQIERAILRKHGLLPEEEDVISPPVRPEA
jgi:recombination protein RecA